MITSEEIKVLAGKYDLIDFGFDAECIYAIGDLSNLIRYIVDKTIPEITIEITEEVSEDGQQYVATLYDGTKSMQMTADTFADFLPDYFFYEMEDIPTFFDTGKLYYSINPMAGFTGQDAWYFCGTETDLKAAREAGIPLIYPGEPLVWD